MDGIVPELSPIFRLQWEESQDRYVLLYPEGMVQLNQSAAEILKRCDGNNSVADIIAELGDVFPGVALTADIQKFITQAQKNGWIKK